MNAAPEGHPDHCSLCRERWSAKRIAELEKAVRGLEDALVVAQGGDVGCRLCGKQLAYQGAVFCGAGCTARWEGGERPVDSVSEPDVEKHNAGVWGAVGAYRKMTHPEESRSSEAQQSVERIPKIRKGGPGPGWTCECKVLNDEQRMKCRACSMARPSDVVFSMTASGTVGCRCPNSQVATRGHWIRLADKQCLDSLPRTPGNPGCSSCEGTGQCQYCYPPSERRPNEARRTAKIVLDSIKDPDGWGGLINDLDLSEDVRKKHFEFSEYASVEIEVDENLNIVSGRILPL